MGHLPTTFILVAVHCLIHQSLAQPLSIYIDGSEGKDHLECLNSSSSDSPCQSLSFVSENLTQKNFVHIEILSEVLNLTKAVNFIEYSNLTIGGSGRSTILYCNESGAGLAFLQVKNLSLDSLNVENCGAARLTATPLWLSLSIVNCTNVLISFKVNSNFSSNTCSVTHFSNGSNIMFISNTSYDGAAMGFSIIKIQNNSTFLLTNNKEISTVGARFNATSHQAVHNYSISSPNVTIFTGCQPGYHYNSSSRCECAASEYLGLEGCYPKVLLRHNYWIGFCSENSSQLCTALCPYGYCSYTQMHPGAAKPRELPNNSRSLDWDICGPRRKNRLCGECSHNHTLYHNSWKHTCGSEKICHLGWLFYILSDLLPLTLLFITVLVLNISFTTGKANFIVLYGQLLCSLVFNGEDSIEFPQAVKIIQDIATFPYNFMNLNFFTLEGLSYCLWKGSTFLQIIMINYLNVGFALVLVLVTVFITRFQYIRTKIFSKFKKRRSFLIHGISAFFVLCYAQAVRATFHTLHYASLHSANYEYKVKVVYRAGHLTYLEGEHVPYAIVAIFVLIFMIITPPLLLLVYPLMFKLFGLCNLSETKLVTILWRMMPIQFLDAFQSSFKDKYRFFAGLYFLYRAAILGVYVCVESHMAFFSTIQLLLTIILTTHFIIQPHKERRHNIADSLVFANLCFINAISISYYSYSELMGQFRSEKLISALGVVQAFLIILPLVVVITLYVVEWKMSKKKKRDYEELPSLRIDEDG